jgi:hypothetical protein
MLDRPAEFQLFHSPTGVHVRFFGRLTPEEIAGIEVREPCRWCGYRRLELCAWDGGRVGVAYIRCRRCKSSGPIAHASHIFLRGVLDAARLAAAIWNQGTINLEENDA